MAYVTGEVALFNEEHAQALLGCLEQSCCKIIRELRDMAINRKGGEALYRNGVASLQTWPTDVFKEAVDTMEAENPEMLRLHKYCGLFLSKALHKEPAEIPFLDFFADFIHNIAKIPDVSNLGFVDQPLQLRRPVVIQALRTSYHTALKDTALQTRNESSPAEPATPPQSPNQHIEHGPVVEVSLPSAAGDDVRGGPCFFEDPV